MNGANYDPMRERMAFLRDSYWGGDRYRHPSATTLASVTAYRTTVADDGTETRIAKRYNSYLMPHPKESDEDFELRQAIASYINLVQPIVDAYAEATASRVQREFGALDVTDVDCRGSEWGEVIEDAARSAILYGWCLAVVDTPASITATSLADEREQGIKPRIILVEPASIAWIDVDGLGRIRELAYVESAYREDQVGVVYNRIRLRVLCGDQWELREGVIPAISGIGASRSAFERIDGGQLPAVLGGRLPVHCLFYRRVSGAHPLGQSLVEDAADIARLIYNALSWASETHRKAGFPFLAVPLLSTGGQMDAATKRTVGPSKAFPYESGAGAPSWIQPSAESTSELREHCGWLFQMALRTAGLEVAADASAQVQSGEALRIRSRDFESRAGRFARNLERWENAVAKDYELLSGEQGQFHATYPKVFTLPDPSEDLANAISLLGLQVEIGPKAKAGAVVQAARAALNLSDDAAKEVIDEVAGIYKTDLEDFDRERAARETERIARMAAASQRQGQPAEVVASPAV